MNETENLKKQTRELSDDELEKVPAGSDIDTLRFSGKTVPLPEARSKKKIDGGYDGPTIQELPKV